tara:strand:- start:969 stop:2012 length:1044 start_codon:yes stop_codon:yes gene_type:complete
MSKIALITGITGQDGAYLAEFLLKKDYIVHGIKRRSSTKNTERIDSIDVKNIRKQNLKLHYGDLTDSSNIIRLISEINPSEIYNLAAQSHVMVSFETPEYTANADSLGTLRILEAIKTLKLQKKTKFYQASTSELFGNVNRTVQNEQTPFRPQSPYATAKLYSYWITKNYRDAYGIFASNGILFNHEGPTREETFVTRKITLGISEILRKQRKFITLGNLDSKRDWGHAKDFVQGIWKILQHNSPDDFVLSTGKTHSVRKFVELAFSYVGIKINWIGKGDKEVGVDQETNQIRIKVSKKFYRPNEVEYLRGDSSKAQKLLKWSCKTSFEQLVKEMVLSDLKKNKVYL